MLACVLVKGTFNLGYDIIPLTYDYRSVSIHSVYRDFANRVSISRIKADFGVNKVTEILIRQWITFS